MTLLNTLHKERPGLKIIMLATDDLLSTIGFTDENAQRLRFEIDPKWYDELPGTCFLNASHQHASASGLMSRDDHEAMFTKTLN